MNEFSLFNSNQKATSKEVVTTKQLAEILGVSERTIRETAKTKGVEGTFHTLKTNGGNQSVKVFNEEQSTIIKQEIAKHHNLANRQIDTVSTELEENQVIANAMAILQRRNVELQQRVKEAERQLTEQAPKVATYNRIANATGLKSMQEVAKILHIGSKTLFSILRDKKIFYREKSNGVNIPVEKYIKQGLFEVKEEPYRKDGKDCVYTRIFTTAKGLLWLEKIIQDLEVSND